MCVFTLATCNQYKLYDRVIHNYWSKSLTITSVFTHLLTAHNTCFCDIKLFECINQLLINMLTIHSILEMLLKHLIGIDLQC